MSSSTLGCESRRISEFRGTWLIVDVFLFIFERFVEDNLCPFWYCTAEPLYTGEGRSADAGPSDVHSSLGTPDPRTAFGWEPRYISQFQLCSAFFDVAAHIRGCFALGLFRWYLLWDGLAPMFGSPSSLSFFFADWRVIPNRFRHGFVYNLNLLNGFNLRFI